MAITPIDLLGPSSPPPSLAKTSQQEINKASKNFQTFLQDSIAQIKEADLQGDQAIVDFATGNAENLHDVMLAMEEADISLRMFVQFRNKALEAYNEIMRLQL